MRQAEMQPHALSKEGGESLVECEPHILITVREMVSPAGTVAGGKIVDGVMSRFVLDHGVVVRRAVGHLHNVGPELTVDKYPAEAVPLQLELRAGAGPRAVEEFEVLDGVQGDIVDIEWLASRSDEARNGPGVNVLIGIVGVEKPGGHGVVDLGSVD